MSVVYVPPPPINPYLKETINSACEVMMITYDVLRSGGSVLAALAMTQYDSPAGILLTWCRYG